MSLIILGNHFRNYLSYCCQCYYFIIANQSNPVNIIHSNFKADMDKVIFTQSSALVNHPGFNFFPEPNNHQLIFNICTINY